jgi:hypothetical protein
MNEPNPKNRKTLAALPDPLPHPDDIIVDFRRNTVAVHGPMDKRELANPDLWLIRKNDNGAELRSFTEDKIDPECASYFDQLERDIVHTKRIISIIDTALAISASPNSI